jgi:hypothetical protein
LSPAAQLIKERLDCLTARLEYDSDTGKAGKQFKEECEAAINDAIQVLKTDLNWVAYLNNLLKKLANAVMWTVSFGQINSSFFFHYEKSASVEAVKEAGQELRAIQR